ncbi:energy transducer TonB [Flavobacterium silvaticum]|uniref:TonB C-terminal domain-containing protein n=1 Tax=Flavobacterium silvaticum TaxID=1852020 RepID=A0A972FVN8_9FLAO|nr:hypothetical protein [Flavobacterium silvaticum]NMH28882.1 hypothetical protein [Flavobacterium silvaticum]
MKQFYFLFCLFLQFGFAQKTAIAPTVSPGNAEEKLYRTPEVDSKPEIQEGMYILPLYVSQNFKLPDVHNKKVKLFVGFVVETDGTISNVKFIHQSVTPLKEGTDAAQTPEQKKKETELLDTMKAESVRVISGFKKPWNPAIKNGKPVRCQYNYPINFNLE